MHFSFSPTYELYLHQGKHQRDWARSTWSLRTLLSVQATLYTAGGVNDMTVTLADEDGFLRDRVVPQPMDEIKLRLGTRYANRAGQPLSADAWTGYVDGFYESKDASQGDSVQIACTGPIKLFQETRQSAADVGYLATNATKNMRGSDILRYAARRCRFPETMLLIDRRTDTGTGFQQFSAGSIVSPDQQPWSSPISQAQANGGIEWYFDESGYLFWREIGFITPFNPVRSTIPIVIPAVDIFQVNYGIADTDVVTRVEVRYYGDANMTGAYAGRYPQTFSAGQQHLEAQLGVRRIIIPAPWILRKESADYLARILYTQYSARIATASVTIPANPRIGVGTLVDLPAIDRPMPLNLPGRMAGPATRYYVTSVTYQLEVGGGWMMTLGLNYGRSRSSDFPYVGTEAYPQLTAGIVAGMSLSSPSGYVPNLDANNGAWVDDSYTLVVQKTLKRNEVSHNGFLPGTVLQLWSGSHSSGHPLGPSPTYTVVAGPSGQATSVMGINYSHAHTAWVTIQDYTPTSADSSGDPSAPDARINGTVTGTNAVSSDYTGPATTLATRALKKAVQDLTGKPYQIDSAGPYHWDCSGCVCWAFTQLGLGGLIYQGRGPNGEDSDIGPNGLWTYFLAAGAQSHYGDVSGARPGDLLFIVEPRLTGGYPDQQDGFSHVAFCLTGGPNGSNFTGQNGSAGVCALPTAGLPSEFGTTFNRYLDLSHINLVG